jgi:hypothetical protein
MLSFKVLVVVTERAATVAAGFLGAAVVVVEGGGGAVVGVVAVLGASVVVSGAAVVVVVDVGRLVKVRSRRSGDAFVIRRMPVRATMTASTTTSPRAWRASRGWSTGGRRWL